MTTANAGVISGSGPGTGRPIRAAGVLALLLGCWGMWRLPILEAELAAAASFREPAGLAEAPAEAPTASQQRPAEPPAALDAPPPIPSPALPPAITEPPPPVSPSPAQPTPIPPFADIAPPLAPTTPPPLSPRLSPAPSTPQPPPATAFPTAPPSPTPGDLAAAAYARLAAGDRRAAAQAFDAALAAGPDPRAPTWARERRRLGRRWSGEAFSLVRDPGASTATAAAGPILGGGQSGASLAWSPNPLARRPIAMVARVNAATDAAGVDARSLQAAMGVRWQFLPTASLSAERLVALGSAARDDWVVRLAGGAAGSASRGRLGWSGYGEAGVIGNGDLFAGAQARAGATIRIGPINLSAGAGSWASLQRAGSIVGRVDIGPSLAASLPLGPASVEVQADWRFRVAGNAEPGSGPALTVSTRF